jgi:hypothetical protein
VRLGLRDELAPLPPDPAGSWADPTASLVAPARLRMLRLAGGGASRRIRVGPPQTPDVQCSAA